MKKKKWIRFSKRLLILLLCTSIVSGTYFNRQKMTVQATSIVATFSAYTLYEICMYIGGLIIGCAGIGSLAYLIDNRDDVARVGKEFIDNTDLEELSDWVLYKAGAVGQSYVFGSEALQEIKTTSFEVIQGGGSSPENNEDNDGDGDKDFDDRTKELEQLGIWGTATFTNWFAERMEELLNKDAAGEKTFLDSYMKFSYGNGSFAGYKQGADGLYDYSFYNYYYYPEEGLVKYSYTSVDNPDYFKYKVCLIYNKLAAGGDERYIFYYFNGSTLIRFNCKCVDINGNDYVREYAVINSGASQNYEAHINTSMPIFSSLAAAQNYFFNGVLDGCLNLADHYRIADWLQEDWQGVIESLNTGVRSLNGNMLIVGQALNQAMTNQLNGLGYISAIAEGIAGSVPLSLPAGMAAPLYYPDPSLYPALDPSLYPWAQPNTSPEPEPGADSDSGNVDDDLDPKDEFGLNMIFGILILLIMIIIMLLIIFISCLAFIVMVFRIEATTGFLPDDMVAALDYLRTLEIPGFGMSVYSFFMALIYILLFFSIVGILRKNIDKIKFPRKGGKK